MIEAFRAEQHIDKIFMQRGLSTEEAATIEQLAVEHKVPVSKVPIEKLNRITRKNHQGIIAFMAEISYLPLEHVLANVYDEGRMPLVLVLDRITDVRNFGAIARTAECVGVDTIVVPMKGAAQVGPDAIKTSAGALSHIAVCREESMKQVVAYLQSYGVQVVACSEKGSDNIYQIDYNKPTAIIMGSEEDGISDELLTKADYIAQIPMTGKVGSLNVSVATGAVLFEAVRQRMGK